MKKHKKPKVFKTILLTLLILVLSVMAIAAGFIWSKLSLIDYQHGTAHATEAVQQQEQPESCPSAVSCAASRAGPVRFCRSEVRRFHRFSPVCS